MSASQENLKPTQWLTQRLLEQVWSGCKDKLKVDVYSLHHPGFGGGHGEIWAALTTRDGLYMPRSPIFHDLREALAWAQDRLCLGREWE